MSASVSIPLVFTPSMTPRMPRPCSVSATITSTGFAVAQKIRQTSGTFLMVLKMLRGNPPSIPLMIGLSAQPERVAHNRQRTRDNGQVRPGKELSRKSRVAIKQIEDNKQRGDDDEDERAALRAHRPTREPRGAVKRRIEQVSGD